MGGNVKNTQLDATSETPTTTNNPTLQPGKTLKDSTAGISVHVCTTSPDGATVAVAINGETTPACPKPGLTLLIPSIETPAFGAPAIPNPVVFAGKSIPGAKIELSYYMKDDESKLEETIADATGNWRIALPSLPSGVYTGAVTQKAGAGMSLPHLRLFEVAQ